MPLKPVNWGPSRRSGQSVYAVHKECLNCNIRAPWISNVAIRKQLRSGSANCSSELWEQSARLLICINWWLHICWIGDCQRPVRCHSAAGRPESVAWTAFTLKGNKCSLLQSVTVCVCVCVCVYVCMYILTQGIREYASESSVGENCCFVGACCYFQLIIYWRLRQPQISCKF